MDSNTWSWRQRMVVALLCAVLGCTGDDPAPDGSSQQDATADAAPDGPPTPRWDGGAMEGGVDTTADLAPISDAPAKDQAAVDGPPLADGLLADMTPDGMLAADAAATLPDAGSGAPQPVWSMGWGDSQSDVAHGVATDSQGNVTIIGAFQGEILFGTNKLVALNSPAYDIFVAQFSPQGKPLWSKRFGGTGTDTGYGIAVDGQDNILITGAFSGQMAVGAQTLSATGGKDIFVAKLSSAGTALWARSYGGSSTDAGRSLAVTAGGELCVTGSFQDGVDFGDGVRQSAGGEDIFVLALSAAGKLRWVRTFGKAQNDRGLAVALNGAGACFVTGQSSHYVGTASAAKSKIALLGVDAAGSVLWVKDFGGMGVDKGQAIAITSAGTLLVAGSFTSSSLYLGGTVLTKSSTGNNLPDLLVARFDTSGIPTWATNGGAVESKGNAVTSLPGGGFLLGGGFSGTLDLGGGPLTTKWIGMFLAGMTAGGGHSWSLGYGSATVTEVVQLSGMARFGSKTLYVCGGFNSSVGLDLGGQPLTSSGSHTDAFLIKLTLP